MCIFCKLCMHVYSKEKERYTSACFYTHTHIRQTSRVEYLHLFTYLSFSISAIKFYIRLRSYTHKFLYAHPVLRIIRWFACLFLYADKYAWNRVLYYTCVCACAWSMCDKQYAASYSVSSVKIVWYGENKSDSQKTSSIHICLSIICPFYY